MSKRKQKIRSTPETSSGCAAPMPDVSTAPMPDTIRPPVIQLLRNVVWRRDQILPAMPEQAAAFGLLPGDYEVLPFEPKRADHDPQLIAGAERRRLRFSGNGRDVYRMWASDHAAIEPAAPADRPRLRMTRDRMIGCGETVRATEAAATGMGLGGIDFRILEH